MDTFDVLILLCIFGILSVPSCYTDNVHPEMVEIAVAACQKNDGLKMFDIDILHPTITVECQDGATFKKTWKPDDGR